MTFNGFKTILCETFPDVTQEQLDRFEALDGLYKEWNAKINVISRKDIDGLYLHHVLHSLAIACYLKRVCPEEYEAFTKGTTVLDLGTGGGFPGIPLAIMFPASKFTLCDSVGKKTIVASEVSKALGLENTTVVNARAESLTDTFGYVVSRAVTTLDNFYPWVKGKFTEKILYLKGGDVSGEIAEVMGRNKLKKGSVGVWKIDSWLQDEYFDGKLVIDIAK